jgi:microcystin-dependent protein
MSYQINFTDSVNKGFIQVDENTVNTETSLDLPGRLKSDYGKLILENLLHLMENFANNNPPTNPIEGQLWYDTTVGVDQLKVYDGVQWVSASSIKKANSRPTDSESNLGDIWVDTQNQQLFLYNGNGWTLVGPDFSEGSNTGAKFEEIIDTLNISRSVIVNYINGIPLLIISNDEFTPKSTIANFSLIKAGLNIATGLKYYGVAEVAENLFVPSEGNVPASNFARRDRDNVFSRPIRVQNNGGFSIGETPTLQLSVANPSNAIFRNLASGGNIQFRLTQGTSSVSVLTVNADQKVGINTSNPTEALNVVGNIKTSGKLFVDNLSSENVALTVNGAVEISTNLSVLNNTTLKNVTTQNIIPDQPGRSIGTTSSRYNNIFAENFTGTSFTGSFIGTFTGTASTATRLGQDTTFQINGDVTSNSIVFGGQDNVGGTKFFTTSISESFITDKTAASSVSKDDEILIVSNNQLRKIRQELLVSTVPTIPIGSIMPYSGNTAPVGWLFCDGSVRNIGFFENLFKVVGYKFDPSLQNASEFRLPDLRARFPMGNPNMGINNVEVGQKGGSNTTTIVAENIPDHIHTLTGDLGTDFYAITNISNAPDSGVDGLAQPIAGTSSGSFINQTGGVINNTSVEPISILNPYQMVNYIIYAGVSI